MELSPIKMAWLGNLLGIPRPFELWNFHRNFIFWIIKCVPANSEHVFSGLESSPAINSSDFMNQKMFPLYLSGALFCAEPTSTHSYGK